MTAPRPVFPDRFLFITRRCTQQQFLLRPDAETNNAFTYCMADAAQRFGIDVVLSMMEPNHHHTAYYDRHGRETEFREHFHKMLAKSQNALRGRWENLWSSEEPCVVEVLSREDFLDKLVYIATNPVKDHLVEKVHDWPGPDFLKALLSGKPMKAHRPKHFFREGGPMPAELELVLALPDHFEGKAEYLAELQRRIGEVEARCARERRQTGRSVMGRHRVCDNRGARVRTTVHPDVDSDHVSRGVTCRSGSGDCSGTRNGTRCIALRGRTCSPGSPPSSHSGPTG